ncbi:MAG: Crp/Fnr family transcriptional regulator [Alphaproteobacteria bacterium]|nr:Crp/Fnr family transcriptional regulator [Alphaproteobacteria bacterium]
MPVDNKISKFLRDLTFFSGLPERDITSFLGSANVRSYKKGEGLFHQGDDASSFFVVISGWVKLFRNTAEGEEALVSLFTRGDVFGEAALFTGSTYPLSAQAADECRILIIPGAVLRDRARKNHDITTRLLESMSREMTNLQRQNEHMALMSAPQRLGCLLLQLSAQMLGKGGTFAFPYDKALAAARLGMKPETFSRALAQLKPVGVTNKGVEISIESFTRLSAFSCGQCTALPGECSGLRCAECPLKKMVSD